MIAREPDFELVSAYVLRGSEDAFRALVVRHVDLVYATALRQVGDSATAEEIAQNVFIALSRKAPRLGRMETIAGWLHRTAILESKARIRADLRRKRREEIAAADIQANERTVSGLEPLIPLLDEALLGLRETDRVALVLRFFEDRSLREVGEVLGVEEEAARKRVTRALERVTEFFRKRGFALSSVGGAAGLMACSTKAAPGVLAGSIARAVSTTGLPAGLQIGLFHFMSLTKLQTAALCIALAAIPLGFQFRAEGHAKAAQSAIDVRLEAAAERSGDAEAALAQLREELLKLEESSTLANLRRETAEAQAAGRIPVPVYRWDDGSPYARVPKALVQELPFPAMADKRGLLTEQVKEVLQMTPGEAATVQENVNRFLKSYDSVAAAKLKQVEPNEHDRRWHPGREIRVFEIGDTTDEFKDLRTHFFRDLSGSLGPERAELFRQKLLYWMPIDDEYHGLNSAAAIHTGVHRLRFALDETRTRLSFSVGRPNGEGVSSGMTIEEIPDYLKPMLADWISLLQENGKGGAK